MFLRSALCTLFVFSVGAISLLTPRPAYAQTQALDFNNSDGIAFGGQIGVTYGWRFALSTTVTVTELGVFDDSNNGFATAHPVGLWNSGGTLLTSGTLAAGLSGTPVLSGSGQGSFRYIPVPHVVLGPGTYVLGAYYFSGNAEFARLSASSISTASGFTWVGPNASASASLTFPGPDSSGNSYFGPNLRFTAAASAAPEPGSLALLTLCNAPLVGAIVRRKRVSARRRQSSSSLALLPRR